MSVFISTRLFGIIAFIMVFTYFAEGIMFIDSQSDFETVKALDFSSGKSSTVPLNHIDWLNVQFRVAYDEKYESGIHHYRQSYVNGEVSSEAVNIMNKYDLTTSIDGYDFWHNYDFGWGQGASDWVSLSASSHSLWGDYVWSMGYTIQNETDLKQYQKNFIDTALDFLGSIPTYFSKLINLFTFNIVDSTGDQIIPDIIKNIAYIFFIPMWIIMGIEVLPVISKIIEAIGSIIPF